MQSLREKVDRNAGSGQKIVTSALAAAVASLVLPIFTMAQSSIPSPEDLIRRVVQNELSAESRDESHWMFRLEAENKNGQKEIDDVIGTQEGELKRPIVLDGHELSAKQRQEADSRLGQDTQALRKAHKEENQDFMRSQRMLRMLPDAFTFSYGERRGDLVQLIFKANPKFRPTNHEEEVFHAMEGTIWVDAKQNRLAEISGHLIQPVKFVGGLLGHLDKGGTFEVKQEEVAPGYWELTVLNIQMKGKALFFKTIGVHQKYSRTAFKRVPDKLTIAQAAQMLKTQSVGPQVSRR